MNVKATTSAARDTSPDFLAGGGEMGALMRFHDWSTSPLGPLEGWPQSLRTSVSTCLDCAFPILVWWGPELVMLYNDEYRPILGSVKHPAALGRPGAEVWPEIWDVIGPMLRQVVGSGKATRARDLLLLLERNGYPEECYFSFSYSPIRDETGGVGGVFCPVIETTEKVIGERRLRTLSELGARVQEARSAAEACERAARILERNAADIPFALVYLLDAHGAEAQLAAAAGIGPGHAAAPERIGLAPGGPAAAWPLRAVAETGVAKAVRCDATQAGPLPGGPWPEPASDAVVLPLIAPGQARPTGFLVAGVSPRRPLDAQYLSFFDLAAGHAAMAIANARAYEEERRRAEALAELDRAKTAFFANVSHEFRTPLALMLGPLEEALAGAGRLPPEARGQVEVAHRNALRLLHLVNSLLDFSRIEAGRAQAHYAPTDLAALTAELASSFRSLCEQAGLKLEVDCPSLPEPVLVDCEMWEKIVLNLLSNAFKFTFEGSIAVSLRPSADGKAAELRVRDTGTGIPPEALPRLFERFHRIEGARGRSFEGSGIGLALVRELVRLHGGEIRVESAPDQGSTFIVTLPFGAAHLPAERVEKGERPTSTAVRAQIYVEEARRWLPGEAGSDAPPSMASEDLLAPPAAAASDRGRRVLLADDNADMRSYVRRLLAGQGYAVEAVADGEAALAAARRQRPDLILSDVMMPRLDGFGLLRALRAEPALAGVPVILLSARAGEEARVEGLEAGADDYLTKPFSARELLARIGANLSLSRVRREATEALRARSEELEAVLATVPAGVWFTHDTDVRRAWGNRRAAAMLRLPEGANASLSAPKAERPGYRAFRGGVEAALETLPLQRAVRGEEVHGDALEIHFADGAPPAVLLFQATPLRDGDGRITGAVCAAVDITDRRRAEEALHEETRTLEVLNHTGAALAAELDLDRIVQMVTDAATELSGAAFGAFFYNVLDERGESYTLYTLSGVPRAAFERFPMPRNTAVFGPTFRGEGIVRSDDITKDPRYGKNAPRHGMPEGHLPVRSYLAVPVASRSGEVLGGLFFGHPRPGVFTERAERVVAGIAAQAAIAIDNARLYQAAQHEIAARRAAEDDLRRLNDTLEERVAEQARERDRIWKLSRDPFLIADADGRWLSVSPAWTSLLGWSEADLLGRTSAWMEHPEDLARTRAEIGHLAAGDTTRRFENRFRARDGSWRWFSWTVVSEGGLLYCVARDVTAEKEAEAALRRTEEQLRQAQKMEMVGQLTGGVAHDFNNLLTVVTGNLDALLRHLPPATEGVGRLRRSAENALKGAHRAAALTHRLLAFSRRQPLDPKPVEVNRLVTGMSDLLRRTLGEIVMIETVLAGGLWQVEADPNQLESAILNLAVNARDAMPGGGRLTVETANAHLDAAYAASHAEVTPGQYVVIAVTDTGTGMPKDILGRVFEPFFTTKEVGQGTGLGLSQVYGFVKQSGGHVKIYSEPGEGTTVKLYLPRLLAGSTGEEAAGGAATPIPEGGREETILVAEDDADVRAYSVESLRELGYRVVEAPDGPSALRLLERLPRLDLLFTDVVLPEGMTGRQLADAARALRPGLKVLFTTGYARNAIVHQGRLDPGVDLLPKPFTYAELAARVRDVLDARG